MIDIKVKFLLDLLKLEARHQPQDAYPVSFQLEAFQDSAFSEDRFDKVLPLTNQAPNWLMGLAV